MMARSEMTVGQKKVLAQDGFLNAPMCDLFRIRLMDAREIESAG
jgi:hypothetical protein